MMIDTNSVSYRHGVMFGMEQTLRSFQRCHTLRLWQADEVIAINVQSAIHGKTWDAGYLHGVALAARLQADAVQRTHELRAGVWK